MMIRDALMAADKAQKDKERLGRSAAAELSDVSNMVTSGNVLPTGNNDEKAHQTVGTATTDAVPSKTGRGQRQQRTSSKPRRRSQSRGRQKEQNARQKKAFGLIFGRGRSAERLRDQKRTLSKSLEPKGSFRTNKSNKQSGIAAETTTLATVSRPSTPPPTRQRSNNNNSSSSSSKRTPTRQSLERHMAAPSSPSAKSLKKFFSRRLTPKADRARQQQKQQQQQQQREPVIVNTEIEEASPPNAIAPLPPPLQLPSLLDQPRESQMRETTNKSEEEKKKKKEKMKDGASGRPQGALLDQMAELQRQRDLLDLKLRALDIIKTETELDDFMKATDQQSKQQRGKTAPPTDLNVSTSSGGTAATATNSSQDRIIQQQKEEIEALRKQVSENILDKRGPQSPVIPAVIRTESNVDDTTALTASVFQSKTQQEIDEDGASDIVVNAVAEMPWTLDPPNGKLGYYSGLVNERCVPSGEGKIRFKNGDMYDGPFVNGQMQGSGGVYMWATGDVYRGELWNNLPHGHGEVRTLGHERYVGNYQFGKLHGFGEKYDLNGKLEYQGQWEYGSEAHAMVPFIDGDATTTAGSEFYPLAADISLAPREDVPLSRYENPYFYEETETDVPRTNYIPECYDVATDVSTGKDCDSCTTNDDDENVGKTSMYATNLSMLGQFPSTLGVMDAVDTVKSQFNLGTARLSRDEEMQRTIERLREKVAKLEEELDYA